MKNVLLISPRHEWNLSGQTELAKHGFTCDLAREGKEAQLKAHKKSYNYIFLDLETRNHSGLEVFKFLRTTLPQARIFLTFGESKYLTEMDYSEEKFLKMGATKLLENPSADTLTEHILNLGKVKKWETIQEIPASSAPEDEAVIGDGEFTRVKLAEFFEDTLAVTDYYIRIGKDRYVKIAHQGEKLSATQLHKYERSGAEYIYFPTKDRHHFIGQQNSIGKLAAKKGLADVVLVASTNACDKFLEESSTVGIHPQLLEEGKNLCQNLYDSSKKDQSLKAILNDYEKFNPKAVSEAFLTTLMCTIICKNLSWVGAKTVDTLALGALLHDIGTLQLEESIRDKNPAQMTAEELAKFHQHPVLGAEAIKKIPGVNLGVVSIVAQHHEYVNGSGFPFGMSSHKIYPLAKIVSLADGFSEFLRTHELSAFEGLKAFLSNRELIARYDSELIKNLILGIK